MAALIVVFVQINLIVSGEMYLITFFPYVYAIRGAKAGMGLVGPGY